MLRKSWFLIKYILGKQNQPQKVAPALIVASGMGISRIFLCVAFHTSSHLRDFLIISWT